MHSVVVDNLAALVKARPEVQLRSLMGSISLTLFGSS